MKSCGKVRKRWLAGRVGWSSGGSSTPWARTYLHKVDSQGGVEEQAIADLEEIRGIPPNHRKHVKAADDKPGDRTDRRTMMFFALETGQETFFRFILFSLFNDQAAES